MTRINRLLLRGLSGQLARTQRSGTVDEIEVDLAA